MEVEEDTEDVDMYAVSSGKRVCKKQPAAVQLLRSTKLCSCVDCVFNTARPGEPAVAQKIDMCVWCDESRMVEALAESGSSMRIRKALTQFYNNSEEVYLAAP